MMKNMESMETNQEGQRLRSNKQVKYTMLNFIKNREAETVSTEKWIDLTMEWPPKDSVPYAIFEHFRKSKKKVKLIKITLRPKTIDRTENELKIWKNWNWWKKLNFAEWVTFVFLVELLETTFPSVFGFLPLTKCFFMKQHSF